MQCLMNWNMTTCTVKHHDGQDPCTAFILITNATLVNISIVPSVTGTHHWVSIFYLLGP